MVALVSVETVLLVLLLVLVAGLLRSHAEIMRRLGPAEEGSGSVPEPAGPQPSVTRESAVAPELAGVTPDGDAVKLAFEGGGHGADAACVPDERLWDVRGVLGDARRAPAARRTCAP